MANQTATPLVSIIMPAHNAGRFIGAAVASVLQQSYPHWELLIVDDASTDNTSDIVTGFDDPRIRYIPVDRIGSPSGVRNVALKQAQGDFIGFLDADDLYYPNTLETLLGELIPYPKQTAVYGFAAHMDEFENPLVARNTLIALSDGRLAIPSFYRHSWKQILTANISCLLSGLLLRKSTLERVGLLNEAYYSAEDYEFYVRLFLDNFQGVHCIPAYVYRYRVYGSSLTKTPEHYQKVLDSCLMIMDALFSNPGIPTELQPLRSEAYTGCYRYLARERLIHHQPQIARNIVFTAFRDSRVKKKDWLSSCMLLLIRSYLPSSLQNSLVEARSAVRQWTQKLKSQVFFLQASGVRG